MQMLTAVAVKMNRPTTGDTSVNWGHT